MKVGDAGKGGGPLFFLLTDFGTTDPFVGVMKAVILGTCPTATLVDLSHGIPPQAIQVGAFWLERVTPFLPEGAIVLAVVDPGVGTDRAGIVVTAGGRTFVGPDNGLLAPATRDAARRRVFSIDVPRLSLPVPSRTFHGRDVFAPVAARLAAGTLSVSDVGPELQSLLQFDLAHEVVGDGTVTGVVTAVDHFGNLLTNLRTETVLALGPPGEITVEISGRKLPLRGTYAEAAPGELLALPSSWGVVEVAMRDGSAARALATHRDEAVVARAAPPVAAC